MIQMMLRPRWVAMLVLALAVAAGFALLGQWQLDRAIASGVVVERPTETAGDLASLLDRPYAEVERLLIEATLARHDGSVPKAARVLELSPSTLYRKIEGWKQG